MTGTYEVDIKCKNCGDSAEIEIPKGTTIEDFGKKEKPMCENCGCETIRTKE